VTKGAHEAGSGKGTEAFVTRVHSARLATRSLDVQTYIWHADLTLHNGATVATVT
jgi:phosphatidylserine/phosphatidylglycerophosphate/cardiolipin synthase-like enzyme